MRTWDGEVWLGSSNRLTDNGEDAQFDAAIEYLRQKITKDPRPVPPHPDYPNMSRRRIIGDAPSEQRR